ncbi:MAG: preprotein translocase subunit SecE [Thermoleophilaceae bacterium]
MARNRQRAKQRQAARRAERLADGGDGGRRSAETRDEPGAQSAGTEESQFELEAPAPPEELGRSDMSLEDEPALDEPAQGEAEEAGDELEDYDFEDEEQPLGPEGKGHATPVQEADREQHRGRGKVIGFLANVWAELQRVQWPNRQQVTTLTGVVLGFVLLAGGYLGLLDAIFSRVIQAIL